MRNTITLICGLAFALLLSSPAFGQLTYVESTDGELSDVFGAPDPLTFGVGVNTISGSIGGTGSGSNNGTDADYFVFNLGANETVTSIFTTRTGPTTQSFIGYFAGAAFTGQAAGDLTSNTLFSDNETLLPGGLLAGPLTQGTHAFWLQETGGQADYSIAFTVESSAIPEPSSAIALMGLGMVGFVRRRR